MKYRADIDGLRTVAVFLVILNHAGFDFIKGGFVGVDVFFVISGFLITYIISESISNQNFSITSFFNRRIKRLMPVLFFVIIITGIVFSTVMLPGGLVKFYRGVIWVILYGANIFFWREHGGYFDGNSQEVPLLHTWSLAVEEQFYLIWPLILVISIKFLGRKKSNILLLILFVVSTVFSQWVCSVTSGAAYYLMPTRFFELLAGACLALWWSRLPSLNSSFRNILSFLGISLIVFSSIFLSEHSTFPGYNALYPVIGTALIIYARDGYFNKYLSLKPMVFTGAISYSLYLWHWPVFVFARYLAVELTLPVQILCMLITYVLSFLSWKYIENPFRHFGTNSLKVTFSKLYLVPSCVLILIAMIGIKQDGYPWRFPGKVLAMETAFNSYASESRKDCHSPLRRSHILPDDSCVFGGDGGDDSPSFFVFGDSHANHMVPFLDVLAEDAGLNGQDYTLDRCLPIFDLPWGGNEFTANKCKERNQQALDHIMNNKFEFVVLAASWPEIQTQRIFSEENVLDEESKRQILKDKFIATLQKIVSSGAKPIIIKDMPVLDGKQADCVIKKDLFNEGLDCSIEKNPNILLSELIAAAKSITPELIVLSPQDAICQGNSCQMSIDDVPIYRDEDHLNEIGAKKLGEVYIANYGNPFSPSEMFSVSSFVINGAERNTPFKY